MHAVSSAAASSTQLELLAGRRSSPSRARVRRGRRPGSARTTSRRRRHTPRRGRPRARRQGDGARSHTLTSRRRDGDRHERGEREERAEEERAREGSGDRAIELDDEPLLEPSVLLVVRPIGERDPHVGHLPVGGADDGEHVLGDGELVERRDVAVEHRRGTGAQRTVLVAVERRREDRRQEQQADDDPGVPCGDRPAAVHGLRGAPGERALGQRGEREPEAGTDEELRDDRPAPVRARQDAERAQPAGDQERAEAAARTSVLPTRRATADVAIAAAGMT